MATLNVIYKIAADITGLQDGVNRAAKSAEGLERMAGAVGTAFAGMFTVTAAIAFGKELLTDADALVKLSDQTDISISTLQRFRNVAADSGTSIEALSGAVFKLQDNVGSGSSSVGAALERIGLSFEAIHGLSPENQFRAVAKALGDVHDQVALVDAGTALFGRQFKEILPAIKAGFEETGAAAGEMSEETVRAMDEAGDAMGRWFRITKGYAAMAAVEFVQTVSDGITPMNHALGELEREAAQVAAQFKKMTDSFPSAPKNVAAPLQVPSSDSSEFKHALKEQDEAERKLIATRKAAMEAAERAAKDYQDTLLALHVIQREVWEVGTRNVSAFADGLENVGQKTDEIDRLNEKFKETEQAINKAKAATEKLRVELAKVEQQGIPAVFTQGALDQVSRPIDVLPPKIREANTALKDLSQAFANLAQISGGSFGGIVKDIGTMIGSINLAVTAYQGLDKAIKDGTANAATYAAAYTSMFSVMMQGFQLLSDYATQGMKQRDVIGASLNSDLAAFEARFTDARTHAGQGLVLLEEQAAAAGISLDRFYAALQQPLKMNTAEAIAHAAEVRAAIQELNDAFDALAKKQALLSEASSMYGPSSADLAATEKHLHDIFDAMTEAGTYSAEQLEKAYYAWQKAMAAAGNEAAQAWVDAHDAAAGGVQAATDAISKLQAQRDEIAKGVANEAPEEVMGVIETQMRAQMAALDAEIAAANAQHTSTAAQAASETAAEFKGSTDDWTKYAEDRGDEAARNIHDAFGFTIHIPIEFDVPDLPTAPAAIAGVPPADALPGFATGTHGQFMDFGTGTQVILHGRERVMTESERVMTSTESERETSGDIVFQVEGETFARISRKSVLNGGPGMREFRQMLVAAGAL